MNSLLEKFRFYRLQNQNILIWPANEQPTIEILNDYLQHSQVVNCFEQSISQRRKEWLACRTMSLAVTQQIPTTGPNGNPLWTNGWVGSLSHKKGHSAFWASQAAEWAFGIDLELAQTLSIGVQSKIMGFQENKLAQEVFGDCSSSLVFAMKEAVYKALFPQVGKLFYFEAANLIDGSICGGEAVGVFCITRNLSDRVQEGRIVKVYGKLIQLDGECFWLVLAKSSLNINSRGKYDNGAI